MVADVEGTKARLRSEARDLYLEVGIARFSLREVARRAGVSPAAVYRHFDSKEALLDEVCAAGFRQFGAYLIRSLGEPTPRARLLRAAELYLLFATENPRDYRVIFMGDVEAFSTLHEKKTAPEPTFQFLIDRVRECIAARVLAPGDEAELAAMIWAHVHGLTSLYLSGLFHHAGDRPAFTLFYTRSVERLLAGLAP